MKKYFKKKEPIRIIYHDKRNFDAVKFRDDIRNQIANQIASKGKINLVELHSILGSTFCRDAPLKEKNIRGTNAPWMNKTLSRAFMKRAKLKNLSNRNPTKENVDAFKNQRNMCVSLSRKEQKKYFNNLDISVMKDNKRYWDVMKPKFTGKSKSKSNFPDRK